MDELGESLRQVPNVGVYDYFAKEVHRLPAAVITWPDIDYHASYGKLRATWPLFFLTGTAYGTDAKQARDRLARYLVPSGENSIKAAIEGWNFSQDVMVTVDSVEVQAVPLAGKDYLTGVFILTVTGGVS